MAKKVKKKNRKMRRQVRKTIGALLMVSAITVAALPVQDISANPQYTTSADDGPMKVVVTSEHGQYQPSPTTPPTTAQYEFPSSVPYAQENGDTIVYTSGDGMFKFAYTTIGSSGNKGAVILDFDNVRNEATITVPETMFAYRKYSPNVTLSKYCLVSISDEFLGYPVHAQKEDDDGNLCFHTSGRVPDATTGTIEEIDVYSNNSGFTTIEGKPAFSYNQTQWVDENDHSQGTKTVGAICELETVMGTVYRPCYYDQISQWGEGENKFEDEQLYYLPKKKDAGGNIIGDDYGVDNWLPATQPEHWRIEAQVAYIGAEYVEDDAASGGWKVKENVYRDSYDQGVFYNRNDIVNLIFEGNSIRGVSDYAFYHCWTLQSVEFGSGLETVGNGAFAECGQLSNVSIASNAQVSAIGKDAFYNCASLQSFTIPDGLTALGDCAFENCTGLTSINLLGSGKAVALKYLGNHLFRGCTSLTGVEFPDLYYEEDLDIDIFQNCPLQYIKVPNTNSGKKINFVCKHESDPDYPNCHMTWEEFRNTVAGSFYFEGSDDSAIHPTANDNLLTFKYHGQELYEKVVMEHDVTDTDPNAKSAKTIYQVNNAGDLVLFKTLKYEKDDGTEHVSRPDILTIPETVGTFGIARIGAGSFNNNCDLKKVTIPGSVIEIGDNAFKGCHDLETVVYTDATRIVTIGKDAFKTQEVLSGHCGEALSDEPELYFVGAMLDSNNNDTVPFKYAMTYENSITPNNKDEVWITCHSGWPTNLEVQYHLLDAVARTGEAQLVGYPRYDVIGDDWVENSPCLTADEHEQYKTVVQHVKSYINDPKNNSLTPEESAFYAAVTNVKIPASVDSIQPGLFSGYTYDDDGEPLYVDVNGEFVKPEDVEEDGGGKYHYVEGDKVYIVNPDKHLQTVLINGVNEIEPYTFKGCTGLQSAEIIGSQFMDDYAFDECTGLLTATLSDNLQDTGKRPFRACKSLNNINCDNAMNFTYSNGILYRRTGNGLEIVECLENRGALNGTGSYNVGPDEMSGVYTIKPEAFEDCKEIGTVDLSKTTVTTIPDSCFKNTAMTSITLPNTLKKIEDNAFQERGYNRLVVYYKGDPITMAADAFSNLDASGAPLGKTDSGQNHVIFQCLDGSNAAAYASEYPYINAQSDEVYQEFTVEFWNLPDYPAMTNMIKLDKQVVRAGEDAIPPEENPVCKDTTLSFTGWSEYRNIQKDTAVYAIYGSPEFTVTFIDGYTGSTLKTEKVKYAQSATPPTEQELPKHEGQKFVGWNKEYYNIKEDTIITARYVDSSGDSSRHKVTFYDDDGKELYYQYVNDGDIAITPLPPEKEGYKFSKWVWMPAEYEAGVKGDASVTAKYEPVVNPPAPSGAPAPSGGGGGTSPSPGGGGSKDGATPTPSATPNPEDSVKKYTVSVSGGSGSGSYPAGAIVAINAYDRGAGQVFDKWTTSSAGVGFANAEVSSTTFTMPAANVSITATYKTGNGSSSSSGASSGSGGSGGSGSTNSRANNGTTVQVTKPGISNTNLAGATVSGATDNFIVKVTEDDAASQAATTALQARFGDLSRIKYFPMDISLYDSEGRTKIADTSGISVNLTLPLPDELIQYAGNNKVAAITGGALEDLNTRFTTVDGVPCVNFTATHFSPYVIYVDTANLTQATIDSTPKTGDPIHPKWFLAIGLACISLILFFKRDKVVVKAA